MYINLCFFTNNILKVSYYVKYLQALMFRNEYGLCTFDTFIIFMKDLDQLNNQGTWKSHILQYGIFKSAA